MKRVIGWIFLFLMLAGCATQPPETPTQPSQPEIQESKPPVLDPVGIYDPDSRIEEQTAGAVRAYPFREDTYALAQMGEDILVFSGEDVTTITKLSGEDLYVAASITTRFLHPEDPSVRITGKGVTYYNPDSRELVFLDTSLKEVLRVSVPSDLTGAPVMSLDGKKLYYCTSDAVRALDMETGISRLLKEISYPVQTVQGLYLGDTVVGMQISDGQGDERILFLSAQNGATLGQSKHLVSIVSSADGYYAEVMDGNMPLFLFGNAGQDPSHLWTGNVDSRCWYLPDRHAAVTASRAGEAQTQLDYFDLASGVRESSVVLDGAPPVQILEGPGETVYLLTASGESQAAVILRWDPTATAVADETVYVDRRYTRENPDREGLDRCHEYAGQISETYGVEILLGQDAAAVRTAEYDLEEEYQVPMILMELEKLERVLSYFPKDFFKTAVEGTEDEILRICLVRSITGTPESGLAVSADGAQFWVGENAYVAFAVGVAEEKDYFHALFHVIDTRVLSDTNVYYEWEKLNPKNFTYDYDYIANRQRQDDQYLSGDKRYFIDTFSMSFPTEDRARIMEYAMSPGNAAMFESRYMQAKLERICLGIRKAFGLTKSPESFLWEQYLDEPMAYQG